MVIDNKTVWIDTSKVVALLGMNKSTVVRHIQTGKYIAERTDGRGSYRVLLSSLPDHAQKQYWNEWKREHVDYVPDTTASIISPTAHRAVPQPLADEDYALLWSQYDFKSGKVKEEAMRKAAILDEYISLIQAGATKGTAKNIIAGKYAESETTIWRSASRVKGHPRNHWLPLLAADYLGRTARVAMSEEAWLFYLSQRLNTSKTKSSIVYARTQKEAVARGWSLPSKKTMERRFDELPHTLKQLGLEGKEALKQALPAIRRDYTSLDVHELWESDGHRMDIMALWPDGTIRRPILCAVRDVRTRKVLAVHGYLDPCVELNICVFGKAMLAAQTTPRKSLLDNGMDYAAKAFTGGQANRYRFQIKPGEPIGMLTNLGIEVKWALPYSGQVKPVESFWNVIIEHVAQLPEFEGAYVGKDTVSRPANFDLKKAVPIDLLSQVINEAIFGKDGFNNRPHSARDMYGKSPNQLEAELLRQQPLQRKPPTLVQLRQFLMAVKTLQIQRDGTLEFTIPGFGKRRFTHDKLADLPRGKKFHIYYDPYDPDQGVIVEDNGRHVCHAQPLGLTGFFDGEAGQSQAKNRGGKMKNTQAMRDAIERAAPKPTVTAIGNSLLATPARQAMTIDAPLGPPPAVESPVEVLPNGDLRDRKNGDVIKRIGPVLPPIPQSEDVDDELERLRSAQLEKNLPEWMRNRVG